MTQPNKNLNPGHQLMKHVRSSFDNQSRFPGRVFSHQRRLFLLAGFSALVTAACSNAARTEQSSATDQDKGTKLIKHAFGETEIPANPARIVVLDYFTVEALMALGTQPIAAPAIIIDNLLHLPPAENEIADIGTPTEPSIEKIATLQPDLILTIKAVTQEDTYSLLSQIAPTVVFDVAHHHEWKRLNPLCAEVLGREAEAEALEASYAAKLQELKSQLPDDGSQIMVSVASFFPGQIRTFGKDTFIGTILEDVGVSRPPQQNQAGTALVSLELLSEIDGDVLFVMNPQQSQTELADDVRQAVEEIKAKPLWNQLKAVQTNQVHDVDAYWFGLGYIAADLVLDDLMATVPKGD